MAARPHPAANTIASWVGAAFVVLASLALAGPSAAGARPSPLATATATQGTPIVEPDPEAEALALPVALQGHDYRAPGPLPATGRGYLRRLTTLGREACRPATHLVSENQEGPPLPVAVVFSRHPNDPTLELDLYLRSRVEVAGAEDLAPPACTLTRRPLGVDRITVIDEPGRPRPLP